MIWLDLETAAPEIVRLGSERIKQSRVVLLGTIRDDGSPRISPVEAHVARGHLLFGTMPWSLKTRDLQRDGRCVLHSAVVSPDSGEGELKLYGRATAADERLADACQDAWWAARPAGAVSVFSLDIDEAAFVSWELERGQMTVRRWTSQAGYSETRRDYP